MAVELVSFDECKGLLGLVKNQSDYPDLHIIRESVVASIEAYTRRRFSCKHRQYNFFVMCPQKMIELAAIPLKTVAKVEVNGEAVGYKITCYGILLDKPIKEKNLVIDYVGGISEVTPQLKRAALLQTVYEYQNKENIGVTSISNDGGSVTIPELSLLKEVKQLLIDFIHPYPVF